MVILCFCTNSEKEVCPFHFVYLLCPFVSGCLLLLSVRYGFVYMFTQCVNLMWLFCVFVPIAKKKSVRCTLFTCGVHSLVVVYYFSPSAIGLFTCLPNVLTLCGNFVFLYQ